MRKLLILLLLCALSAGAGKALYYLKKGFSPRRIHALDIPVSHNWSAEASQALSQPFSYIGRGRQCFAFVSEDGKYVLKLPRTDIYKVPLWIRVLPLPSLRTQMLTDRAERQRFLLESIRIAHQDLPDQTGIIALHLGQSAPQNHFLILIDALGCRHHLPLHKTPFILQHKQPLLIPAFEQALANNDPRQAKKILNALIAAIIERGQKGILNRDRSFLRNYGYDGTQAYQIDVGSFFRLDTLDATTAFHKSVNDSMDAVKEWMAKAHPEMIPYLNESLDSELSQTK